LTDNSESRPVKDRAISINFRS